MFGVGLRFTLLSGLDRAEMLQSAQAQQRAAEHALQGARERLTLEITKAWNQTELARRTFVSLESSLAAARENLRVQELGFREGVGRASEVITAQSLLDQVQAQRVLSAYEYDLALASLLVASNRSHEFVRYMNDAEHRLPIPAATGEPR